MSIQAFKELLPLPLCSPIFLQRRAIKNRACTVTCYETTSLMHQILFRADDNRSSMFRNEISSTASISIQSTCSLISTDFCYHLTASLFAEPPIPIASVDHGAWVHGLPSITSKCNRYVERSALISHLGHMSRSRPTLMLLQLALTTISVVYRQTSVKIWLIWVSITRSQSSYPILFDRYRKDVLFKTASRGY